MDKFSIQNSQYSFPYHYIPYFDSVGSLSIARRLSWGLDYVCYQLHLNELVLNLKPESVLEVGCGDGYFLGALPPTIETRIGVDLSERAIAFAKAFHPELDFRVQNASSMAETFDVVVAIEVLEHIPNDGIASFLHSLSERTKRGGKVIITVPTIVAPLNQKHYRHYSLELLAQQIKNSNCKLEIIRYEYIFAKPWWYGFFIRAFDNRLFALDFKPLTAWAWQKIWRKYRYATSTTGLHLVAVLEN